MFAEPLSGFRQATARPQRTKVDWAVEVAALLDTRYADCDRVTLVCDNLNTHTIGAFYEAFEPELARQYVRRIQFCYTPKHGSWLNVAECELSGPISQLTVGLRCPVNASLFSNRSVGIRTFLGNGLASWPAPHLSIGPRFRLNSSNNVAASSVAGRSRVPTPTGAAGSPAPRITSLSNVAAGAVVELHPNSVRLWRRRWAQGDFSLADQAGRGRKLDFSPSRPSRRQSHRL